MATSVPLTLAPGSKKNAKALQAAREAEEREEKGKEKGGVVITEAAKEEELSSVSNTQPPDLCATSVASVVQAKETPPCVEVASL